MLFDRGVEITLDGVRFVSNYACHSDERPIGVTIVGDGKVLCHTGDTMYHRQLLEDLPRGADALLIPINGQGYNMNVVDAARLVRYLIPTTVYPMHWDLFKQYGCDVQDFIDQFKETEREFIRRKQADGIAAAKARGVRFGLKPMEKPKTFERFRTKRRRGEISARKAATQPGVSHNTFVRRAKAVKSCN
jgi:L-ascorbate metabolism protein UlaG (beta-lactamase superfamily)